MNFPNVYSHLTTTIIMILNFSFSSKNSFSPFWGQSRPLFCFQSLVLPFLKWYMNGIICLITSMIFECLLNLEPRWVQIPEAYLIEWVTLLHQGAIYPAIISSLWIFSMCYVKYNLALHSNFPAALEVREIKEF